MGDETTLKNFFKPSYGAISRDSYNSFNSYLDNLDKRLGANAYSHEATGDFVADDTAELQAALTAGAGSSVTIPEGTFGISSTLNISSNTTFVGHGRGAIIKGLADFGDNPLIRNITTTPANNAARDSGIAIGNLCFDGNRANNTTATQFSHCIRLTAVVDSRVENCWLVSPYGDGILLDGYTTGPRFPEDVHFVDNKIYDSYRNGIAVTMGRSITIQGNQVYTTAIGHGIDIEPDGDHQIQEINIIGNTCKLTNSAGIALDGSNVSSASKKTNWTILGNTVRSPADPNYGNGIFLHACPIGTIVSQNAIFDTQQYGIFGDTDAHDVVITGNAIRLSDDIGIYVNGDRCSVTGNYVTANAATAVYVNSSDGGVVGGGNVIIVSGNYNGIHCYNTNDICVNGNFIRGSGAGASNGNGIRFGADTASMANSNRIDTFTTGLMIDNGVATSSSYADNNTTGCGTGVTDNR